MRLFGSDLTRAEVEARTGNLDQLGGVLPIELTDGPAHGLRGFRLTTGSGLGCTVLADRALDISHADFAGTPLCWRSSTGDLAPAFVRNAGREWLRSFAGGLLVTCGLANFGPPGDDIHGEHHMHGRANGLPARNVAWRTAWEGDELLLEVSGTITETRVFGEVLVLERRLRTYLGSSSLWLEDTVTNRGFERTPHMILYHFNLGYPLLDAGARVHASHSEMRPRDEEGSKGIDDWQVVTAPQPGFLEQVFIHTARPCADGRAVAALVNDRLRDGAGLGVAIHYDPAQLPALIQWRMLGQGMYVMGLEPANTPAIEGREEAVRRGTLPFLEPGETRTYNLELRALTTHREIDELVSSIDAAGA